MDGWITDHIAMPRRKRHGRAATNPCRVVCLRGRKTQSKIGGHWGEREGGMSLLSSIRFYEYYDGGGLFQNVWASEPWR